MVYKVARAREREAEARHWRNGHDEGHEWEDILGRRTGDGLVERVVRWTTRSIQKPSIGIHSRYDQRI